MLLTSAAYFVFLAIVFFTYWPSSRKRIGVLSLIAFANLFFYTRWNLWYLTLVPGASLVDFAIGLALRRTSQPIRRKLLVSSSILLNIGLIASLKLLSSMNAEWALPLALSFYAFQSLTYTIDIYRRDATPVNSYLVYLCASSFFPTTIAGPITRVTSLLKQFENRPLTLGNAESGRALFLIGLGLIKKFLIADYLAEHLVNRVFDTPDLYSGAEVLTGVYAYALQLYYDFSGYSDIAIGSALLLGIRLPANFNRPYSAANLAEFWRRWHISLSNWLRDYLYFSLPGLRSRRKIYTYLNLVITMALGGLWHGVSWNFLIWGLLHGCGLALLRWFQTAKGNARSSSTRSARLLGGITTVHFVTFAWIFFRAPSLEIANHILMRIGSLTISYSNVSLPFLFVLSVAAIAMYLPERWYESVMRIFVAAPAYAQAGAMALLVLGIEQVANTGAAPFIYARF